MNVYQQIGKGYDLTRRADPYITARLAHHLQLKSDTSYLDVACGTGNYTLALAKTSGTWHAVDQSQLMIDTAISKNNTVAWQVAKAEMLPFADSTFSGVVCTLAIHHFAALLPTFQEIHRVIASGRFVLFTATPAQMEKYWLVEYFPVAMRKSAEQMPQLETVINALNASDFDAIITENYSVSENLQDLFLYSGKHRPELYLDAHIRSGISTFALLASPEEITSGCQQLAADIKTGMITKIRKKYEHNQGDYLFVIANKVK